MIDVVEEILVDIEVIDVIFIDVAVVVLRANI